MGLERLLRRLYGAGPQIDIELQIARVRVPKPMKFDFRALEQGIKQNNVGTAGVTLHAQVKVADGKATLSTGQSYPWRGAAPGESEGMIRLKVLDWSDPSKTSLGLLN